MYTYKVIVSNSKRAQNYSNIFLSKIPKNWEKNDKNYNFLFLIGGDGTLFSSKNYFINKNCNVILINGGNFGFFSSFDESNIHNFFNEILDEKKYINTKIIKLYINNKNYYAINDIYILSFAASTIDIYINEIYYEKFKGTGLVFSTPLGSSALNKSSGGAVIIDDIDCYQMTEINPLRQNNFSTLASPIIISNNSKVRLKILKNNIKHYFLVDGIEIDEKNFLEMEVSLSKSFFKLYNPINKRIDKIKKAFIKGI